ncbi:glycosyltransferase [Gammaproteobacteria bacterium]|nr:glycosyltransferase [Gammaproteobacteria bacterium]MDC3279286.1 glycosyltransferase [Gammaproteobacteria bacterium]
MKNYLASKFSVLLPIYLRADPCELQHCLQSLVSQTLLPDEVVVVEDGPITHELDAVLIDYSKKLNLVRHQCDKHRGLGPALQDGLLKCSFPLVARVDSDDTSVPERFQWQIEHLESNPQISIVGGVLCETLPSNSNQTNLFRLNRELPTDPDNLRHFAKYRNPLSHPTVMFRRCSVLAVGGYQDCPFFEDYFLWVRMLIGNKLLSNLERVLVHTTADNNYFSRRTGLSYRQAEWLFAEKLLKLGFHSRLENMFFRIFRIPLRFLSHEVIGGLYSRLLRKRAA